MNPFYIHQDLYSSPIFKAAHKIVSLLQSQKYIAYFVGGSVRDALLKRPINEIDIVTNALPEDIIRLFPYHKPVGAHFGVILVYMDGFTFDVASFREDGDYIDGRRPTQVYFSSPQQDAQRRDFTMNGLFYNPMTQEIIDYVGGLEDIEKKHINTIGKANERFEEDKLRMLRCIRFFTQLQSFGFTINTDVLTTIQQKAPELKQVSKERIREEVIKIINASQDIKGIQLLFHTQLAQYIFPAPDLTIQAQNLFLSLLPLQTIPFCLKYLSLILNPFLNQSSNTLFNPKKGSNWLKNMTDLFLFHNQEIQICKETIQWIEILGNWELYTNYQKKRALRSPNIQQILLFLEHWTQVYQLHKDHKTIKNIQSYYQQEENNLYPTVYITGDTLIQKGLKPSALFKVILERIENEQLEGNIQNEEQAFLYLDDIITHI